MFMSDTFDCKCNMRMLHSIIADPDFGANKPRFRFLTVAKVGIIATRRDLAEMFLREFDHFIMRNTPRTNQYHPVCPIILPNIFRQIIAFDTEDILLGSKDCTTERLTRKCGG